MTLTDRSNRCIPVSVLYYILYVSMESNEIFLQCSHWPEVKQCLSNFQSLVFSCVPKQVLEMNNWYPYEKKKPHHFPTFHEQSAFTPCFVVPAFVAKYVSVHPCVWRCACDKGNDIHYWSRCVCACIRVCACMCVCACTCVCVKEVGCKGGEISNSMWLFSLNYYNFIFT